MDRILVVEDEETILMALQDDLQLEGYEVASASDGVQGLARAREGGFDLIILDVMLPGLDGFEVCKRLRAEGVTTPIIMLTAKSQEVDKVLGLELGADDYVTKPFSPRELLARVKAGLRRGKPAPQGVGPCRFGNVEVDFEKYEATKNGAPVDLTTRGQCANRSQLRPSRWRGLRSPHLRPAARRRRRKWRARRRAGRVRPAGRSGAPASRRWASTPAPAAPGRPATG